MIARAPPEPPAGETRSWWQRRRRALKVGIIVGGVLVALAVLGSVLEDDQAPREERDRGAVATAIEPEAEPEPESDPEPEPEITGRVSDGEWAIFSRAHSAFVDESQGFRDSMRACNQTAEDQAGFWACIGDAYVEFTEDADRAILEAGHMVDRVGWECRDALRSYISSAREYRAALVDTRDIARLFSFDAFEKTFGTLTPMTAAWGSAAAAVSSQCPPE